MTDTSFRTYRLYSQRPSTRLAHVPATRSRPWLLQEVTLPLTEEQAWKRLRMTSLSNPTLVWKMVQS